MCPLSYTDMGVQSLNLPGSESYGSHLRGGEEKIEAARFSDSFLKETALPVMDGLSPPLGELKPYVFKLLSI